MSLGRVDRYDLLEQIGQGSFGSVFRARHIHTGQLHALKLARGNVDHEAAARVLSEARAAAGLRHPNIVTVSDGGTTPNGESFVVMELLEGQTVAQLIARHGPMPVERAAWITRQMLDALVTAHASRLIHRDVKPSNVFIVGSEQVKVIDFGISKVHRDQAMTMGSGGPGTLPGVALGTPGYMAPEQLGDARSVDGRADVYAVGATLFEMLTARKPIESDSFETWMRRLRSENATPVSAFAPHLPPALCTVVDRALARDPDARWPSAHAMKQALEHAVPGSLGPTVVDSPRVVVQVSSHLPPPPVTHPPPAPHAGSSSPLPWIAAALAGLLAVVALAVTGGLFYLGREQREQDAPKPVAATSPPPTVAVTSASPIVTTTSTSKATSPPPAPPGPAGAVKAFFSPGNMVGELRQDGFLAIAERARGTIDACNPDRKRITVRFDMHVHENKIGLVRDAVNDPPGDVKMAKCCAYAIRDAQFAGQKIGSNGIYSSAEVTWK